MADLLAKSLARREAVRPRIAELLGPDEAKWQRTCPVCEAAIQKLYLTGTGQTMETGFALVWDECRECWMRERLTAAGVPLNLVAASFDNWRVEHPDDQRVLAKAREFAQGSNAVGFLMLESPEYGNGKTHLAVAILRHRIGAGSNGRMWTQAEFLRGIRRRYDDRHAPDVVDQAKATPLLILDDIGISVGGKDELPTLHEVLAYRYGEKRRTVLTMNIPPSEFRDVFGPRMASRLREATFAWNTIKGGSQRAGNRGNYLGR
jgi:DNA replication protein DnaC